MPPDIIIPNSNASQTNQYKISIHLRRTKRTLPTQNKMYEGSNWNCEREREIRILEVLEVNKGKVIG
jgi:hypothetical protein